jgi:signal transduction histidine kinase
MPSKKAFYFRELAERVINLTREQSVISGAVCTYVEKSEDVLLYADEGQITQILINLVKNAVQAEAKNIMITAEINLSEHIIINVTNDGHPISKESQEEIFVPFYTTKQEGTGIGLSLSRQIMRLHNGSLKLTRSDAHSTVFTLIFK